LQAHLDMVCEKNSGVEHDFLRDSIRLRRDGDWIGAVGTTLGADNGLGVAAAMAVAVDQDLQHGPLELLFTLDEETGLNGAAALDPSIVQGRWLINLDTEEDGAIYIGCAGAAGVSGRAPLQRQDAAPGTEALVVVVKGLSGGHSGVQIHEPRGNAIKVMARLLAAAIERRLEVQLISVDGGSKANAIPRECFAQIRLPGDQRAAFEAVVEEVRQRVRGELGDHGSDVDIAVEASPTETVPAPLRTADRDRLVRLLDAVHHGVWVMSSQVPGLVETSANLAVVSTEATAATVLLSLRSSSNDALHRIARELVSLCQLAGWDTQVDGGYPGWAPEPSSPLVRRTAAVYESLFAEAPAIKAVHAGLECGLLSERLSGLKAVSIGPEIRGAHSPDERLSISSTQRFYRFLGALLDQLSPPGNAA
jgi:dipeptidase D